MQNNLYYQDEYIRETFSLRMFGKLLKSAAHHKKPLFGSIAIEAVLGVLSLMPSFLYSVIISQLFPTDGVLQDNFFMITLLAAGGLLLTWFSMVGFYYLEDHVPVKFGSLFSYELRSQIMNHVMTLSFRYFDTHSTGKILVRVTNYVDDVAELFGSLFYSLLYCAAVTIIGLTWILVLDVRIGGIVIAALIPLAAIMYFLSRAIHHRAGKDHNKSANYTAFVAENIGGAEVVRAYNRAKLNGEVAEKLFKDYSSAFMRTTNVREAFFPLSHGFTNAIIVLIVYGAALAIGLAGGVIALATVVAIGTALSEVTSSVGSICDNLTSLFTLTSNLERVYDTIETPVEIFDSPSAVPLENCRGEVSFEHVDFSYVEGIPVLKDFSLHARPGETIALVGATGSGKTTVVNLLSRFYDVQGGSVRVDNRDVRDYTLKSLRTGVGAMMQDTFIFSGTVLDNIRFARPNASDEECKEAARAACADPFIMRLPKGYDTEISEDYALSGGERQLLSFARLILADPRIIVLDEATSHVDTQTELEVQLSLKALLKDRTSFVIAHRLSTIRGADRIVVISGGEIAEQGSHEELMRLNGRYAAMVNGLSETTAS